jgi:hypothetical protein
MNQIRLKKSYGCTESLGELAGIGTPKDALQNTPSDLRFPEHHKERENTVNSAFANLLLGIRVNDELRQNDAYAVLIRIARSVAHKLGGYILHSGDWEEVATTCIHQELLKHKDLTAHEIVECCESKKFAYLWKAFKSDFVDEIRKFQRRQKTVQKASVLAGPASRLDSYWDDSEYEWTAEEYGDTAQSLPVGPAAIAMALGELYRNPGQLLELTSPELSQRSCKSRFVEYVAERRGVDAQVVRKDVKQFKDHAGDPEYVRIMEILRDASPRSYQEHEQFLATAVTSAGICEEEI